MRARVLVVLALAAAALGAAACGQSGGCCGRYVAIPTGVAYHATLGNPDGGPSTEATLTLWEDGGTTLVFEQAGHRVELLSSEFRN